MLFVRRISGKNISATDEPLLERRARMFFRVLLLVSLLAALCSGYFALNTSNLIRQSSDHVVQLETFMSRSESLMNWIDTTEYLHTLSLTSGDDHSFAKFLETLKAADNEFQKLKGDSSAFSADYEDKLHSLGTLAKQEFQDMRNLLQVRRDRGLPEAIQLMRRADTSTLPVKMRNILLQIRKRQLDDFNKCRADLQKMTGTLSIISNIQTTFLIISVLMGLGLVAHSKRTREKANAATRLASLVCSSPDAIFSVNNDHLIDSWNQASTSLFGYSNAEILGKDVRTLSGRMRIPEMECTLERIVRGRSVEPYETMWFRKDGAEVNVSVSAAAILSEQGEVLGATFVARDIRELVRLQQQRQDFVAALSHDLKNPLIGNNFALSEIIADPPGFDSGSIKEILERVVIANERMLRMIGDLLDVYKIDCGAQKPVVKHTDLRHDLELIGDMLQPICKKKRQKLILQLNYCDLCIETDDLLLRRIVMNLLDNASKYSQENSTILLKAENKAENLILKVIDNGPGVSRDKQRSILGELPRDTQGDALSHGIGLYLSQKLCQSLHCDLSLATSRNGSEFILTIPRNFPRDHAMPGEIPLSNCAVYPALPPQ